MSDRQEVLKEQAVSRSNTSVTTEQVGELKETDLDCVVGGVYQFRMSAEGVENPPPPPPPQG